METAKLKRFAQFARRSLMEQVSAKLKMVLAENSGARRERADAVKKLEEAITGLGAAQVIERVAYIWFNRFCALRFMDVNRYTRIGVVSPTEGQFQPEILADAKMGHIEEEMAPAEIRQHILALLDGRTPSRDPQGEAYRLLVVAVCNYWNSAMPFLFERINDYTELLMPEDLLSGNSILAYTREAMTPDACQDVEVIGWLYQFYISEKKDEVFEGLKKNRKITPENIPAATQLFTPHWIVRYLVENSLGRLWLLNHPGSKLADQMDYYIKPEQTETDFLRIKKPEEIKICDPACGSGHMLTYAFDLLYAIYEEEGHEPAEISEKILAHNIFGIEIDERAGELAAFALIMKAASRLKGPQQRRFFRKGIEPQICVLEAVRFDEGELNRYMEFVGQDLFTLPLLNTLHQLEEADNFGSLICPDLTNVDMVLKTLEDKNVSGQLFLSATHKKVLSALTQTAYLSGKYHVVIANPPYMSSGGMNGRLGTWTKDNYPDEKSDLFAMFMERSLRLALKHGMTAMISMQTWMFLSSFETFRTKLLSKATIVSMAHIGERGFDSIGGVVVSTTAFVLENSSNRNWIATYLRLVDGKSEADKSSMVIEAIRNPECGWLYRSSADGFVKIPGHPIAYWASKATIQAFEFGARLGDDLDTAQGMKTLDNERFIRRWGEVSFENITGSSDPNKKWVPINHGGGFRKWYGFQECVLNWHNDGEEIKSLAITKYNSVTRTVTGMGHYFEPGITWSAISSGLISVRKFGAGYIFTNAGMCAFGKDGSQYMSMSLLNSKVGVELLKILAPSVNFGPNQISEIRIVDTGNRARTIQTNSHELVTLSMGDWNAYETSWDFIGLPIVSIDRRQAALKPVYQKLRSRWREMTLEMKRLEEENNHIFIDAYGLQNELAPEIPLNEVTLTCNPHYRYGGDKTEEELEALLLADTMRELISYAVGCMFGRYALDKPGLILANQDETIDDYLQQIPAARFPADSDNVVPLLDDDWFADDAVEQFRKFLKIAFGEEHFEENVRFVEDGLNIKAKRDYSIREYFLNEFYTDHVKRYRKRPIYWLFSSPKGSFNALIYMHRYRPDTVGVVLNDYLREFRTKLIAEKTDQEAVTISSSATQVDKTKALKKIEKISKMITELEEYEREILYPLATEKIEIDLDDGVKANYPKFGAALKKIPGLEAEED